MSITGAQLRNARQLKGWNQGQAAHRLGVSQAYLSLLEKGRRRIPERLSVRAVRVFELSEVWFPLNRDQYHPANLNEDALAEELAALGYTGLTHLGSKRKKKNPAEVLLSALGKGNLDSRLVEALPWVVLKYPDMDWDWLILAAKVNDLQNRLGYVLSVGRRLAELQGEEEKAVELGKVESSLERSRLVQEDTLCHDSMTEVEKKWLRKNRPAEAKHWRILTDLTPEQYDYAS